MCSLTFIFQRFVSRSCFGLSFKEEGVELTSFPVQQTTFVERKAVQTSQNECHKTSQTFNRVSQTLTEQCMHNVLSMYTRHSSHCMYISPPSHLPLPLFFLETWIGERSPELEVTLVPWWLWAAPLVNTLSHVQLQWFAEQMDAGR